MKATELNELKEYAESQGFIEMSDPEIHASLHMQKGNYHFTITGQAGKEYYRLHYACPCCGTNKTFECGFVDMSNPKRVFKRVGKEKTNE